MVRVPIRVREGAFCFDAWFQARSIRRAVRIAADRYPNADVRVSFPIDADAFFVEAPGTRAELLRRERPGSVAA